MARHLRVVLDRLPGFRRAVLAGGEEPASGNTNSGGLGFRQLAGLARHRVVIIASFIQFTRLAVVSSLRFWLPTYLVADKGLSLAAAGLVIAIANIVTLPANLLGGYLSDRSGRPHGVIIVSLVVLTPSFALLTVVDRMPPLVAIIIAQYVVMQAYAGSLFEIPFFIWAATGRSLNGFGNFWANIGGLVFAWVLGVSKDHSGSFDVGWMMLGGLCLLALVAAVAMSRVSRRASAKRPRETCRPRGLIYCMMYRRFRRQRI